MRRTALIAILITLLVGMLPGTASAWCNGPAKGGHVGNGYGTHDWILDRAIKVAGARGAWVNRTTALLATDNPDSLRTPVTYHWFKETGSCRGAPQMVGELYHKAIVAYRAGNKSAASTYLGTLSHYYSDITQPFHATGKSAPYATLHRQYENSVDGHTNTSSVSRSWATPRATVPVTDIRAKTVSAALYARTLFPSLLSSYRHSRSVRTGTPNRITKLVLTRAVNDLADIISSIPSGSGQATTPATVDVRLSTTAPRGDQRLGTLVTITDGDGNPLNGVGVKFVWRLPTGTVTWLTFTNSNGYAYRYQSIGSLPHNKTAYASAYVTANGVTASYVRSFIPRR